MSFREIVGIIPEFNSTEPNSFSANKWIENFERLMIVYGWVGRTTLLYATLWLTGAASYWNQSQGSISENWESFKVKGERRVMET